MGSVLAGIGIAIVGGLLGLGGARLLLAGILSLAFGRHRP
jgi:hypothetical protein